MLEAPQMYSEEDYAVAEADDSQNGIYNQMAEHERLLAAQQNGMAAQQNGMLLFPSRSQSVGTTTLSRGGRRRSASTRC